MILRKKNTGRKLVFSRAVCYLSCKISVEKISVLKQHAAASIYLLTTNDPTRHITFLDIKVLKVSLVES